ncbi:MAG: radical SAM protein [Cyanobacteria bacterium SIG29]|nr:radical SAM protein [Cyanobacteria bacterium SIG29]
MRVCDNLNNSICFNYKNIGITYCTLTNANNGKGWPKISDEVFDGQTIDWDKFFEERAKHIEAIKNSCEREECKNCQQISDMNFIDDKKLHYILLSPWQICNSDCIYCLGHAQPISEKAPNYNQYYKEYEEPYDMLAILKDMIEKDVLAKDAEIDFAGGEPTLYPKFDELINFFLDNGFKNIIIHTNNIQYSKAIERGIKENAISLMISIDAGTKKCHEKVKGVKSFDKVWHNFKKYSKVRKKDFSKRLCAKYVIVPNVNDTKKEFEEFIKQAHKNGATQVALNVYNQLLNEMNYEENLLNHLVEISDFWVEKAKEKKLSYMFFPNIGYVYKKLGLKRD